MGGRPPGEEEVSWAAHLVVVGCSHSQLEGPEMVEALEVAEHCIPPAPYPPYRRRVKNRLGARGP